MKRTIIAALSLCALSFAAAAADSPAADPCRMVRIAGAQAEQGNADAMDVMGSAYYSGECVEMNFTEAAKWYQKAAQNGSVKSQAALGAMFFRGQGVRQDYKESFRWLSRAATEGSADPEYSLAVMYQKGLGTDKNLKKALSWYAKACDRGFGDACEVTAKDRFREFAYAAGPLKQQVEICYFDLGGLRDAEPNPDTGASSCSGSPEDRARGAGWDLGRAVKDAVRSSRYVKSASVENGVITLTTKDISIDGKSGFTLIWVPSLARSDSDGDSAMSWWIAEESTCLEAGLCRNPER